MTTYYALTACPLSHFLRNQEAIERRNHHAELLSELDFHHHAFTDSVPAYEQGVASAQEFRRHLQSVAALLGLGIVEELWEVEMWG